MYPDSVPDDLDYIHTGIHREASIQHGKAKYDLCTSILVVVVFELVLVRHWKSMLLWPICGSNPHLSFCKNVDCENVDCCAVCTSTPIDGIWMSCVTRRYVRFKMENLEKWKTGLRQGLEEQGEVSSQVE